jgi:hypothetical protein
MILPYNYTWVCLTMSHTEGGTAVSESPGKISNFLQGDVEQISEAVAGSIVFAIMELTTEVRGLREAVERHTFARTSRTPGKIREQMDKERPVQTLTNGGKMI